MAAAMAPASGCLGGMSCAGGTKRTCLQIGCWSWGEFSVAPRGWMFGADAYTV